MPSTIHAIIGLGNPGPDYQHTRHNAGAWLIEQLAKQQQTTLRKENKLFGRHVKLLIANQVIHLFIPETFMNCSGKAVAAFCNFYKLRPDELLIAHDELDFDTGIARFKHGGGHGGHNGLRDITKALNSNQFSRLRIGIGHPGNKNQVSNYVLKPPSQNERIEITKSIDHVLGTLDKIVLGQWEQAMHLLHSK